MQSSTITWSGAPPIEQYYKYDWANRLEVGVENPATPGPPADCSDTTSNWCQQYGLDRYGNRRIVTSRNLSQLTDTAPSGFNVLNQITDPGWSYDAAGNVTADGSRAYQYDAENRLTSAVTTTESVIYRYDGDGRRVEKVRCTGAGSCTETTAGAETTKYVYDAMGNLAVENADAAGAPPGQIYVTADALGSTRQVTDETGTAVECEDYLPYGEYVPNETSAARRTVPCYAQRQDLTVKFSGKERDSETNLDYFGARYFSGAQGRFTGPDEPLLDQDPEDPQSWNLYSYVRNSPLIFTDPTGRCKEGDDGKYHDSDEGPCVAPGGTSVTVTAKAPKERDHAAEVQAEMTRMQYEAWKRNQERNKPKEDQPLTENAQRTLQVSYERTVHDLGCVALGYGIETAAVVPSMEIVPKAFAPAGAKGGTSIASTLLRGGPRGLAIPTPVGTPGTATFAWRSSNTVGGVAGRWLPYIGLGVSVYRINKCLGQQP